MRIPKLVHGQLLKLAWKVMDSRPPDILIGGTKNPLMQRWHMYRKNTYLNVYVHKILRDDDDRALHDHPVHNVSLVLQGAYFEITFADEWGYKKPVVRTLRRAGDIIIREAKTPHMLKLVDELSMEPTITIWITFWRHREWGFWCEPWKTWQEFGAYEVEGPGCD